MTRRGPDNSARVSITGTVNGKPWANIFHVLFTTSGTIAQADLDSWLTTFAANYKTFVQPQHSTVVAYVNAQAVLYVPGNLELISNAAMTGTGSGTANAAEPDSNCLVVSWVSNVYWRGGKPRTYLAAPDTTKITTGTTWTTAFLTTVKTAAIAFITATNAQSVGSITSTKFGFVSFFSNHVARTPPLFYNITSAVCHPRLATQRRRLGKWTN